MNMTAHEDDLTEDNLIGSQVIGRGRQPHSKTIEQEDQLPHRKSHYTFYIYSNIQRCISSMQPCKNLKWESYSIDYNHMLNN